MCIANIYILPLPRSMWFRVSTWKMICKGFSRRWCDDVKCLYVYELVVGRFESLKTFTALPRLLLLIHTYMYILHRTRENIWYEQILDCVCKHLGLLLRQYGAYLHRPPHGQAIWDWLPAGEVLQAYTTMGVHIIVYGLCVCVYLHRKLCTYCPSLQNIGYLHMH